MIELETLEEAQKHFQSKLEERTKFIENNLFFLDMDGNEVRIGDEVVVAWQPDYDDVQLSKGKITNITESKIKFSNNKDVRKVYIEGVSGHPNRDNEPFEYESHIDNSQIILKL